VLTVGASNHHGTAKRSDDTVAEFSSRGPTFYDFTAKPDLLAPGVGIESLADGHSTLYGLLPNYLLDGTVHTPFKPYLSLSGTSMSAPVVAGTVALMLEANPSLSPNAVKAILQYTAQELGSDSPFAQGTGLLNALGAVRLAKYFASPSAGLTNLSDEIAGEVVPWSRHLLWGNYLVDGGILLPGSNAWSLDVSWGALSTPSGAPVVFGNNIVWSTRGDGNIVWSTLRNSADQNIVWSTGRDENIVWSTGRDSDGNIVWSTGRTSSDGKHRVEHAPG
jgi:subtilisin family serine protease